MDLDLTPEQRAFRDEVRTFIREKLPSEIRERLRAGHPPRKQDTVAWQRILNERGWAAPHWPVKYGGTGWSPIRQHIFEEESSNADAPYVSWSSSRLVAPVVNPSAQGNTQALMVVDKTPQGIMQTILEPVHFVPLKSGVA